MSYTVYYKPVGGWFWRKIKNVTDDGLIPAEAMNLFPSLKPESIHKSQMNIRFFLTEEKERFEIPMDKTVIRFSRGRADMIQGKIDAAKGGGK